MSSVILYNKSNRRWTGAGDAYLIKILTANQYPSTQEKEEIKACTGVTERQLQSKLNDMRKRKLFKIQEEIQEEIQVPPQEEISVQIAFLNSLESLQPLQLYDEMIRRMKPINYINPKHIKPTLTVEELKNMTSHKYGDGAHFAEWMSCLISAQDILAQSKSHPQLWLSKHPIKFRSVDDNINNFCKKFNRRYIIIQKHHITLRTKEDKLPVLSTSGMTASHLCDTIGCVSKDHILLEPYTLNAARKWCEGITLTLCPATGTAPAQIIKATACEHGRTYTSSEDQFNFSCRKIKFVKLDEISVAFLNKIKK